MAIAGVLATLIAAVLPLPGGAEAQPADAPTTAAPTTGAPATGSPIVAATTPAARPEQTYGSSGDMPSFTPNEESAPFAFKLEANKNARLKDVRHFPHVAAGQLKSAQFRLVPASEANTYVRGYDCTAIIKDNRQERRKRIPGYRRLLLRKGSVHLPVGTYHLTAPAYHAPTNEPKLGAPHATADTRGAARRAGHAVGFCRSSLRCAGAVVVGERLGRGSGAAGVR